MIQVCTSHTHPTFFHMACHMADTGCMYSFRLATRSMEVDPNATDSGEIPGDRSRCHGAVAMGVIPLGRPSGYDCYSSPWLSHGPNRNRWFTYEKVWFSINGKT